MTGRELRHLSSVQPTSPAKGSGDGEISPATPRRLQPSDDNVVSLADVREAEENGHGEAFAEWATAIAPRPAVVPSPGPDVSHEEGARTASKLLDAETAVMAAGKALKLEGNVDLHLRISALTHEIREIGGVLADRWGS